MTAEIYPTTIVINGIPIQENLNGRFDFGPLYRETPESQHAFIGILEELVDTTKRERAKSKAPTTLYFLQSTKTLAVKIGITTNLQARIDFLTRAHGYPLKLLHELTADDSPRYEKILHAYWKTTRIEGEWFTIPSGMTPKGFIIRSKNKLIRQHGQPPLAIVAREDG